MREKNLEKSGGGVYLFQKLVIMKKFIILVFLSVFPVISYAQFYDDEDEIHFYVSEDGVEGFVCNFDGERATYFCDITYVDRIRNFLAQDPNHFEKCVYTTRFSLTYTKDYPSVSYIAIRVYQGLTGNYNRYRYLYTFSYDKKTMNYRTLDGSNHIKKFKEVPKEYFLPGRRRSDLNNERIYE